MSEFEGDSTLLAHSTINRLDTRNNHAVNQTSLNVLNVKKGHKTHIQKQFQEFGKQQIHQNQIYLHQQQQQQQQQVSNGVYGNMTGSKSTVSFQSQSSSVQQQHMYDNFQPHYRNSNFNNSQASFHSNNNQWYNGNDLSTDAENYDGFSNYTTTPEIHQQNQWNSNDIIADLEEENQLLILEINKFKKFRELNEVLIEENEILREKLEILKENNETKSISQNDESLKLKQELINLKHINDNQMLKIETFKREKQRFELELESMNQEITKLKLINIENKKAKDKQIESLKLENDDLAKELDILYQKNESASTSLQSTPKSSTITPSSSTTTNSDFSTSFKLPPSQSVPQPQRTPPQNQSKTFPTMNSQYSNEELINDLLMTIRQLKSDNEVLITEKENIAINLARQKKFVKRFVDSRPHGKVKLRNGLNIVETVDVLI